MMIVDTSQEYINMCEKAVEIQRLWKVDPGDMYSTHGYGFLEAHKRYQSFMVNDNLLRKKDIESEYKYSKKDNSDDSCLIWLPTQRQLQEIAFPDPKDTVNIQVNKFWVFCLERNYRPGYLATACFDSMEQLWLAFVMHEKFNKVWDGKDWNN